jgi:thioester reductase-like protein
VPEYTLLTGSTGLLGRYLLRDLLLAGKKVAVVVRANQALSAQHRIEAVMQRWERELGTPLSRPICLSGDVTEPLLGLDEASLDWVAKHCSSVIHSAASLTFLEEGDGEPWRTNLEGTRHVLALCHFADIRELHYVSTAYVCGMREGVMLETELDCGQRFRNDYEKSKLQAEQLVRNDKFIKNPTVYRPAVIAGDSRTGYTNTYHGLFMYLKIMSILARTVEPGPDGIRHTEVELHLSGDEQRNVIPVDWASAVMCHLYCTPEAHGRTYHLAPQVRMTPRDMISAGCSYFNSTGVEFVGAAREPSHEGSDLKRHAYDNSTLYRDSVFDMTNLTEFAGHLPCPAIDEVMIHRYLAYGERDRWGKRRERKLEPWFDVIGFFATAVGQFAISNPPWQIVGLDLLGPGGGQWTLTLSGEKLLSAEPGIAPGCEHVYALPTQVLAAIAGEKDQAVSQGLLAALS